MILCHAACTGGSLLYRVLVSTFDLCGLSEIGHTLPRKLSKFNPLDPESQMLASGLIRPDDFDVIMMDRIINCDSFAAAHGKRLLIREHTHGYLFYPQGPRREFVGPSWFADHYQKRTGNKTPIVISVRDPIDSWLGFRRNFAQQDLGTFETYCQIYNEFLDRADNIPGNQACLVIRYEDFLEDPQREMDRVAAFCEMPTSTVETSVAGNVTSGSSGRRSSEISRRPRRPFTSRLLTAARTSDDYRRLCERLGYKLVTDDLTQWDLVTARKNEILSWTARRLQGLESPARWLWSKFESGKNMQ